MTREPAGLRFLYHTAPGRAVLKVLTKPGLSRLAGRFLDSGCSRIFIVGFRRANGISMENTVIPAGGFPSFNSFFCRRRTDLAVDETPDHLCSPCDAFLTVYPIGEDRVFSIKNTAYSLRALLGDPLLADDLTGGYAFVFRLTPAHYHRYIYVDNGTVIRQKKLPGILHTVRPIATEQFPVFIQNSREYVLLQTENFGRLVQMEVGAMLVGRICNDKTSGFVSRGQERGHFEFGGSTILLLTAPGTVQPDPDFCTGAEKAVCLGQCVAKKIP